jgi:hypothetical protein
MSDQRIGPLRDMLEEIDGRLLSILTGASRLDDASLGQVATLETARGAVQRLLTAMEMDEARGSRRLSAGAEAWD